MSFLAAMTVSGKSAPLVTLIAILCAIADGLTAVICKHRFRRTHMCTKRFKITKSLQGAMKRQRAILLARVVVIDREIARINERIKRHKRMPQATMTSIFLMTFKRYFETHPYFGNDVRLMMLVNTPRTTKRDMHNFYKALDWYFIDLLDELPFLNHFTLMLQEVIEDALNSVFFVLIGANEHFTRDVIGESLCSINDLRKTPFWVKLEAESPYILPI
jgi:hypothetical protein